MKKSFLTRVIFIVLFVLAPFLVVNNIKADTASGASIPTSDIRTAVVVQINQEGSLNVYIVMDEKTGDVYISEATDVSLRMGDTVSYSPANSCSKVIVRPVIRK